MENLMIGDFIYITPGKIGQVYSVNRFETGRESALAKDENRFYSLTNITPIPLTAEILKKNGFKEKYLGIYTEKYKLEQQNLYLEKYCGAYWFGTGQARKIEIKFVHELQHLFYLCGLRDMAENFKI